MNSIFFITCAFIYSITKHTIIQDMRLNSVSDKLKSMKEWSILGIAILLVSCEAKNTYIIEGEDHAFENGQYMFVADATNWSLLDSARIENHTFRIESENIGTGIGMLYMGTSSDPRTQRQISNYFFLETGHTITYHHDTVSGFYLMEGSPMNEINNQLDRLYRDAPKDWQTMAQEVAEEHHDVLGIHFIDELRAFLSKNELQELIAGFPPEMREHPLFIKVEEKVNAVKAEVGTPYYDLRGTDIKGDSIFLGKIISRKETKYVLLDFWGTWCGPCRAELPNLKNTYEEYKDKGLEIFAVAFDNNRDVWEQTIVHEGLDWINIIASFDKPYSFHPFWRAYGLTGIPNNFLIDTSNGLIISKDLRGEDLRRELAELLD